MLSACHLSISVFITLLCLLWLTPSLAHSFTLPTVSPPARLYLCLTLRQSQGFRAFSFSPRQLSFIDVFLDVLCFPPRSFCLHLLLSLSLCECQALRLRSHSESAQKSGTICEKKGSNGNMISTKLEQEKKRTCSILNAQNNMSSIHIQLFPQ